MKLKINFLFFIISILGLLACGAPEKKHSSLMTQGDSGNENTPDHLPPPPPVLRGPTQPDQSNPQKPNDTAPEFSFGFSFSSNDYNKNEATLRKLRKHRGKVEEFRDIKGQERNNAENEALEKRKEFDQKDKERQEAKKQRDKAGSEYNAAHNEAQIQEGRKDHAQSQVDRRGQQVQKAEENYRQASDAHKRLEKSLKSAQFALEKDTKELLLINNMLGSELIKGVEKQQLFEERRRALESQVVELQNHVDSLNRDLAWLEALERHQNSLEQPEQSPQPQELSNGPRMEPFQPATQAIALINDYKEQNPEAPTAPDFGSVKLSDTAEASAGVVAPGGVNITPDAVMKAALIARAAIQAPLPPHIKIMGAAAAGATGYALDVQVYDRQLGIADGCDKTIEDGIECLKQLAQKAAEGIKKYSQDEIENAEYFDDNPLTKKFREEIQQSAPIPHAPAPAPSVFHEAEDIQPQTRSGQEPPKPTPPTAAQRPPAVPETTVGPASTPYSATSPHVSDGAAPTQRSEDWLKTRTLDEIFAGPPKSPREIKEWMEARRQARIEKYGHNASPYTAQENSNSRPLDLPLTPPQGVVESQPQTPPQASQWADRPAWDQIGVNGRIVSSGTAGDSTTQPHYDPLNLPERPFEPCPPVDTWQEGVVPCVPQEIVSDETQMELWDEEKLLNEARHLNEERIAFLQELGYTPADWEEALSEKHRGKCEPFLHGGPYIMVRAIYTLCHGKQHKDDPTRYVEVHHMPAHSSMVHAGMNDRLWHKAGPSVAMSKLDHSKTASHNYQGSNAIAYTDIQTQLILSGQFRKAVEKDIKNLRLNFGGKYEIGIQQMEVYLRLLESSNIVK